MTVCIENMHGGNILTFVLVPHCRVSEVTTLAPLQSLTLKCDMKHTAAGGPGRPRAIVGIHN